MDLKNFARKGRVTAHSDSLLHHLVIPYRKERNDASDRESGFVLAFLDSRFCGNDKERGCEQLQGRGDLFCFIFKRNFGRIKGIEINNKQS